MNVPRTIYPHAQERVTTAPPLMSTAWISFVRAENERNVGTLRNWASTHPASPRPSPRAQLAPLGTALSPRQKLASWKPTTLGYTAQPRYPPFLSLPHAGSDAAPPPVKAAPKVERGVSQYIPPEKLVPAGIGTKGAAEADAATLQLQHRFKEMVEKYYQSLRKAFVRVQRPSMWTPNPRPNRQASNPLPPFACLVV